MGIFSKIIRLIKRFPIFLLKFVYILPFLLFGAWLLKLVYFQPDNLAKYTHGG